MNRHKLRFLIHTWFALTGHLCFNFISRDSILYEYSVWIFGVTIRLMILIQSQWESCWGYQGLRSDPSNLYQTPHFSTRTLADPPTSTRDWHPERYLTPISFWTIQALFRAWHDWYEIYIIIQCFNILQPGATKKTLRKLCQSRNRHQ